MENQPHPLDTALGARIRNRRKALGLSQSALGAALGLTFQQVQKYERGKNRVSFSKLVGTAHALNCTVSDLITGLDRSEVASPAEEPLIKAGILNGLVEHTMVYQDKETGVWIKVRPDCVPTDGADISDLKTIADITDDGIEKAIGDTGLNMQGAMVGEACREVLGQSGFRREDPSELHPDQDLDRRGSGTRRASGSRQPSHVQAVSGRERLAGPRRPPA